MKSYYLPLMLLMACAVNAYTQKSSSQTVMLGVDKSKKPDNEQGPNFANRNLSNLLQTSINADLIPDDNKRNLGSLNHSWKSLYLTGSIYLDGKRFISNKGVRNTFLGSLAGNENTAGIENTAVGYEALLRNTAGSDNVAVGLASLTYNTTGSRNSAIGANALYENQDGSENSAFGALALAHNTTGSGNTAMGFSSLELNTIGVYNTAMGIYSLNQNTIGHSNTAVGGNVMFFNTEGNYNTAMGRDALYSNSTGEGNTVIGFQAMKRNTVGLYNSAFGASSLIGNTTGYYNVALGGISLPNNTTGTANTACGTFVMVSNSTGFSNTAIGVNALYSNSEGYENTAVGMAAMIENTVGVNNSALGGFALYRNATGNYNTAIGNRALIDLTNGSLNTAIGMGSGDFRFNFSSGTLLGAASNADDNLSNFTVVGFGAYAFENNQVVIGNTQVTSIGGYANWSNFSDGRFKNNVKENVPGLQFITQLRPVTYTLDIDGIENVIKAAIPDVKNNFKIRTLNGLKLPQNIPSDHNLKREPTEQELKARDEKAKIVYTGFVAQEVEKLAMELNYDFSGVDAPGNENGFYALRYGDFVVPLVKAVQELNRKNEELEQRIQKLEALLVNKEEMLLNNSTNADKKSNESVILSSAHLEQNSPNPSKTSTIIRYFLPNEVSAASVVISDMKGKIIKTISLKSKGSGQININTALLTSGTYSYSLVIDGKQIDTRLMIIAR